MKSSNHPIGIFDSGFGGLSIFKSIREHLPEYDYIFLGDNGRAPYGNRSFEEVFQFTLQAVKRLFEMGCPLVILACNTASAKALRNIQQTQLPFMEDPSKRVLGVICPTIEKVHSMSHDGHIGLVGTNATISSHSYEMELAKVSPKDEVVGQACPQWVPLIESGQLNTSHTLMQVKKDLATLLQKDANIDTIILGCTHYPLIIPIIQKALSELNRKDITLLPQGEIVGDSLKNYLKRHPEMDNRLSKNKNTIYYTTGDIDNFEKLGSLFLNGEAIKALKLYWE